MGISDIPPCKPYDILCNLVRNAARAGVYNEWAQENLVQVTGPFFFTFLATTHITIPPSPPSASITNRRNIIAIQPNSRDTSNRITS